MGMKIKVAVLIDVDTDGWEQDYGVSGSRAIRQDVQAYVDSVISECNPNIKVVK